jgi:hypothetical protein
MVVYWITKTLGVKGASDELSPEDYGSIIVDLRDITDGKNEDSRVIADTVIKVFKILAFNYRVILQCQAGISRSPAFAALLFVYGNRMYWDNALDLVKKNCPIMQINQDLLDQMKMMFE